MILERKKVTNHHEGQWIAQEYDFWKRFWQIGYVYSNYDNASQNTSTKQEHVKEICSPSPERVLFEKFAISSKKEHVEHKVQVWHHEEEH